MTGWLTGFSKRIQATINRSKPQRDQGSASSCPLPGSHVDSMVFSQQRCVTTHTEYCKPGKPPPPLQPCVQGFYWRLVTWVCLTVCQADLQTPASPEVMAISHLVSLLTRTKASSQQGHPNREMFQGTRGHPPGARQGPNSSLECTSSEQLGLISAQPC
jgi:hypothetical protein